jgi:predicted 3-demethylubiquinone-9 3-methyltransferase (glyoxalase superfamily)
MKKIVPHLWFDREAKEAARFYTSLLPDSEIIHEAVLRDTPSGDCDIVSFRVGGHEFQAISAGPYFKFNPSTSFFLNFDPSVDPEARSKLDQVWGQLSEGGTTLLPLGEYPFSKRYGWIQDRYGLSWQLILTNPTGKRRPVLAPSLLFVKQIAGQAEAAIRHYLSIFQDSELGQLIRWPDHPPEREGSVMFADFRLENEWFAAMDSADPAHDFGFNEAVSFIVHCDTQEELDEIWDKLSAVKEAEQCGWLKDRFGISWQIVPSVMEEMMKNGSPEQIDRLTRALLPMKKLQIEPLKRAYAGKEQGRIS